MNIGDHNNIAYNNYAADSSEKPAKKVAVEILKRCADKVSWMFWDPCAITVVFCACFRCFGYENNMALFEREFGCKEDLISRTLRNHPYMRLKLDEWEDNGAPLRAAGYDISEENTTAEEAERYARFFDITILSPEGEKIEPAEAVDVKIELMDESLTTEDVDFAAVHFEETEDEEDSVTYTVRFS